MDVTSALASTFKVRVILRPNKYYTWLEFCTKQKPFILFV